MLVHTALRVNSNRRREFTLISCKLLDVAPRWRPHSSQILLNPTMKIYQHHRGDYHQRTTYQWTYMMRNLHTLGQIQAITCLKTIQYHHLDVPNEPMLKMLKMTNHLTILPRQGRTLRKIVRWYEAFPGAGAPKGRQVSSFEKYSKEQKDNNEPPWAPFESEDEWELAKWLMESGASQNKVDSFLKLNSVSRL